MGELFRINKMKIVIKSNDHDPAHLHVIIRADDIEFRVFIENLTVEYITQNQLSARDEKKVLKFIEENRIHIQEEWHETQKNQKK